MGFRLTHDILVTRKPVKEKSRRCNFESWKCEAFQSTFGVACSTPSKQILNKPPGCRTF